MNRVTITGADDRTPISALVDLTAEFPFVEWGILVSMRQEGGVRFPSRDWQRRFATAIGDKAVSMHVCGEWTRQLLRGRLDWNDLPADTRIVADRVQINTHAEEHVSTIGMFDWMERRAGKQFIIQLDGVNDHIFDAAVYRGLNVAGLFDCSHGAGLLPAKWPKPCHYKIYHGFAGGLGPVNAAEQAKKIVEEIMGSLSFWIDMEGRVRTEHEELDLVKVRTVLETCAPMVER
jgi:hypothetical protein